MTLDDLLRSAVGAEQTSLVVQGGGMRGVYSMGALAALEARGLTNAFSVAIGSSAGAINAAYFLAGQAEDAVDVYVEYLSNRNFVNPWRVSRIVNIDYLVDDVLKVLQPLDIDALRISKTDLEVILTDAETGEAKVVSSKNFEGDLYEVFRATAALPGLYDRRVQIGDRQYVDGGVVDGVPLIRALQRGADRVLAVITREPHYRRKDANPILRRLLLLIARTQSAAVKSLVGREDPLFNAAMDLLDGTRVEDGVRTWCVWPRDPSRLVGRTTSDKKRLQACAKMGREDMLAALDSEVSA